MGDMADYALDCAMDDWEEYQAWVDNGRCPREGYDKGILDELGRENTDTRIPIRGGYTRKSIKPTGPGPCPKCESDTEKKSGPFGDFYGCTSFPVCKGSRNLR